MSFNKHKKINFTCASVLPIMIYNASYFFGRETSGPEVLRKRACKRADVTIGETTTVEYISGARTPATS